jgi:hypothetical protein
VKLTRQGVRDLNGPKLDGSGHNGRVSRGGRCRGKQHHFVREVIVGTRWVSDEFDLAYEVPIYGRMCAWCTKIKPLPY